MTLPDWLDPLYEAGEMRAVDSWAIEEQGVPSLDLMERAGIGLARATAAAARGGGPVRIVIGKGNNGGDGLVIARHLDNRCVPLQVILFANLDELSPDAAVNYRILTGGVPVDVRSGKTIEREELHADLAANSADYVRLTELGDQLRLVQAEKAGLEERWLQVATDLG